MQAVVRALAVILVAVVLVGCEEKLTVANYDRIEEGMTLGQVEAILGSGEEQTSAGVGIDASGLPSGTRGSGDRRTILWEEGGKQIIVTLQDDVVAGKRKIGF